MAVKEEVIHVGISMNQEGDLVGYTVGIHYSLPDPDGGKDYSKTEQPPIPLDELTDAEMTAIRAFCDKAMVTAKKYI